jgi:hypothetical protein
MGYATSKQSLQPLSAMSRSCVSLSFPYVISNLEVDCTRCITQNSNRYCPNKCYDAEQEAKSERHRYDKETLVLEKY